MKKVSNKFVIKSVLIFTILSVFVLSGFNSNSIFAGKLELRSEGKKDVIVGVYLLKSCENGRFKIKIEKKENLYTYNILDLRSIIEKGNLEVLEEDGIVYLIFGKIEGVFDKKSIVIQNYGNSMNEYILFTQCDEKYLSFEKIEEKEVDNN